MYDSAVPLLESCPSVHQKICVTMFIVLLFIKVPNWKQPRCLIKIYLINKLCHGCTMEYYKAMRVSDITTCNNVDESQKHKFQ